LIAREYQYLCVGNRSLWLRWRCENKTQNG
jgi:hypothetical protein